jgi:hypothetical protein
VTKSANSNNAHNYFTFNLECRKPFSHAHTKSVHVPYTLFRELMRAVFSLVLVLVMAAADAGPGAGAGAVE